LIIFADYRGITNFGNTCFLNACIQTIRCTSLLQVNCEYANFNLYFAQEIIITWNFECNFFYLYK